MQVTVCDKCERFHGWEAVRCYGDCGLDICEDCAFISGFCEECYQPEEDEEGDTDE